jgi:hypothetical protein
MAFFIVFLLFAASKDPKQALVAVGSITLALLVGNSKLMPAWADHHNSLPLASYLIECYNDPYENPYKTARYMM